MTTPGEKNPLFHQTAWTVSTVLALLGHSDVLTILGFSGIEHQLVIMRIAVQPTCNHQLQPGLVATILFGEISRVQISVAIFEA